MGEAENKQAIQRAFDAWAAGQGGVFDLLEPDARWTIVGNSVAAGTDGDTVIAYFDASATVRDGSPYDNTYTWYLRMQQGAIVEAVAFFDSIEFNDFWARVEPA
jgi:ketosteroid isomerase-like protein